MSRPGSSSPPTPPGEAQLVPDEVLLAGAGQRAEPVEVLGGDLGQRVGDDGAGAVRRGRRGARGHRERERERYEGPDDREPVSACPAEEGAHRQRLPRGAISGAGAA